MIQWWQLASQRAGISHLVSEHDVGASSAFFCFDTTWTHPSEVQPVRFLQLGLSHTWQHSPVVMLHPSTCLSQAQQGEGPPHWGREQTPTHSQVTHCNHRSTGEAAGEALSLCVPRFHQETSMRNIYSRRTNLLRSHGTRAGVKFIGGKSFSLFFAFYLAKTVGHCGVGIWRGEGKGITSTCEHLFLSVWQSVLFTALAQRGTSATKSVPGSRINSVTAPCLLPWWFLPPHLSSLYLPTPSRLLAKVTDPLDGTMSVSGESQNDGNNKVLGRGGDPQVTGVPTSTLAALLPPQIQVKQLNPAWRTGGSGGSSVSLQWPEEGL